MIEEEQWSDQEKQLISISEKQRAYKSSWNLRFGPVNNLLNIILGAGVLGLPFALRESGLLIGLLLLAIVGLGTLISFFLLLWSSDHAQCYSYGELAEKVLGRVGGFTLRVVFLVDIVSTLSAYLVLVGDSLYKFSATRVEDSSLLLHPSALIGISLLIILPLSLLRNISFLPFTSFLSLLPLGYLILLQIIDLASNGVRGSIPLVGTVSGFFVALPILIFSFASQISFFSIYEEMKNTGGQVQDIKFVIYCSTGVTLVTYFLVPMMGVLEFPASQNSNIMLDFSSSTAVDILLITMAISIILSYPVFLFPAREAVDELVDPFVEWCYFKFRGGYESIEELEDAFFQNQGRLCDKKYVTFLVETLGFVFTTAVIALWLPSFGTILGLSGAITKTIVCYLFPCLFYLFSTPLRYREDKKAWLAMGLFFFGLIGGALSTYFTIGHYVKLSHNRTGFG